MAGSRLSGECDRSAERRCHLLGARGTGSLSDTCVEPPTGTRTSRRISFESGSRPFQDPLRALSLSSGLDPEASRRPRKRITVVAFPPRSLPTPPPSAAVEKTQTFTHPWGKGREEFYRLLQSVGWEPCEESDWDLDFGTDRVFIATEQIPANSRRTYLRYHGSSKTFARLKERAKQVGFVMAKSESDHIYISKTQ